LRYFVVVDNKGLLSTLPSILPDADEKLCFIHENAGISEAIYDNIQILDYSDLANHNLTESDRVLILMENIKFWELSVIKIRTLSRKVPILLIDTADKGEDADRGSAMDDPCLSILPLNDILRNSVKGKFDQFDVKHHAQKLINAVDTDKSLYILTQDDPDPDAIASGLALRELLGMDENSAPIVTLKPVSRSENINMISLLGISVRDVTLEELKNADQIAMVDVHPSFFKTEFNNVTAIIDHHPVKGVQNVSFTEILVKYGATATIMTEYLLSLEKPISEKLATALYYGIKTDTLILGREVSKNDFDAFTHLWHLANHSLILQMERPMLKPEELDTYIRALKGHVIRGGAIFVPLGKVPKVDLVPRLADFVLQIGKTEFALVWGEHKEETVFCARSLASGIHAGEVLGDTFSSIGNAGGHKSMARAEVNTDKLGIEFLANRDKNITQEVIRRVLEKITEQKKKSETEK
jgi:nanoRNase/pAp phosphatase (c-di-AMP/oligoRNAs hydrolase)